MPVEVTPVVVVLKTVTLVLGGLVTYHAFEAYRRTGTAALRAVTIGFGVITVGATLAGAIDRFSVVDPRLSLVVESGFTTAGFAVILYALYRR